MTEEVVIPPHPAKFSDPILEILEGLLEPYEGMPTIDPFCGVGRLFEVAPWAVGYELEEDWAKADPRIQQANSLHPPHRPGSFRAMATSAVYPNRMTDHHNAMERCRPCQGTGRVPVTPNGRIRVRKCPKCDGVGRRDYKRLTYTHQIGHPLHPDNSGAMGWGPKYRAFHEEAWAALLPLLVEDEEPNLGMLPPPVFILNMKDHWKTEVKGQPPVRQEVTRWHIDTIEALGWKLVETHEVEVKGMRFGANRDVRDDVEYVLVFYRG